jgi:hypothetical protein
MFAALAFVDFLIALVLRLAKVDTGSFDLLYLGLALLSLHFVWAVAIPYRRSQPPQ